jgi:hypothetical protein
MEVERVKTLKDKSLLKKHRSGHFCAVINSNTSNSYQFYIPKEDYYIEVGSSIRGNIPEKEDAGIVFDVASSPKNIDEVKDKLMDVAIEKLRNDTYSINAILNILKKDKNLDNDKVELKDFIKIIEDFK